MADKKEQSNITINEKSIEVLIAKFIPTSKYFETKFEYMQCQIQEMKEWQKSFETKMDKRFEKVDEQFVLIRQDMDKRFEKVNEQFVLIKKDIDKRFEQVDKRFEQINEKLDKVLEKIDMKIDRGLSENRAMNIRLFSFAMMFSAISMVGLLGKMAHLF